MSKLSKAFRDITGQTAAREANDIAQQQLAVAQASKAAADTERAKLEAEKKTQQNKINKKSVRSARAALRRPGFLESSVEGTSDVLG